MDVLGDGAQLQALGHPHGGEDDLLVDGVGHQVAHEGAVDLQVVERETLQVLEGGQAGAEVVQRDAEALGLQVVHQSGGGCRIPDGLAFGDLEDHLGGRDGVVGTLFADEVGDGVVTHRGAGQVDRALPGQCQRLGIGGQPLEGQADHAAVQRHRHLCLRSQREEFGRTNQLTILVAQPRQDLVGAHLRRRLRIDQRLGIEFDPVVADGVTDVLDLLLVGATCVDHRLRQRLDEELRVAHAGGNGLGIRQGRQAVLTADLRVRIQQQPTDVTLQPDAAMLGLKDLAAQLCVDLACHGAHLRHGLGMNQHGVAAG